jgi:GNAT superfamily N-acetyltransferase
MLFSDLPLSRRLERAEGFACVQQAEARLRHSPDSGAAWIECGGAYAVFDGIESPCTQTFGLGLFEGLRPAALDTIESFFCDRGAQVFHEVSPFAGVEALALLCERGYRPIEVTSILYQTVEQPADSLPSEVTIRVAGPDEADLWSRINTRGWTHDHPELESILLELGAVMASRDQTVCFLGEIEGHPRAAGALCFHEGVALFAGAATTPEFRGRGLQSALLRERKRYAFEHECDLAMMGALPGSNSQRNAERSGFRIAYTRTKWQLFR